MAKVSEFIVTPTKNTNPMSLSLRTQEHKVEYEGYLSENNFIDASLFSCVIIGGRIAGKLVNSIPESLHRLQHSLKGSRIMDEIMRCKTVKKIALNGMSSQKSHQANEISIMCVVHRLVFFTGNV